MALTPLFPTPPSPIAPPSPSIGGARILAIGDSFVGNNGGTNAGGGYPYTSTGGPLALLEAMSFGRFRFDSANNKGVTGQTTAQILARWPTDVLPNFANFDILWVDGGRNDDVTSTASGDATVANLVALCELGLAAGKTVFLPIPNPPRSYNLTTDAQRRVRSYVNRQAELYARGRKGVVFIDYWRDWVDPTVVTGVPATGITIEGLHADILGAISVALRTIDTAGFAFPLPRKTQAAWDQYDTAYFPKGNMLATLSQGAPLFQGTGGNLDAGASGVVATNWNANRYSGNGQASEVVFSKEAATPGYDSNGGDRQIITLNGLSSNIIAVLKNDQMFSGIPAVGTYLEGSMEVELFNLVGCVGLSLYLYHYNGSASRYSLALNNGSGNVIPWPNGKYLFRTPPMMLEGPSPQAVRMELTYTFNQGGSGVIKCANPVIRPL